MQITTLKLTYHRKMHKKWYQNIEQSLYARDWFVLYILLQAILGAIRGSLVHYKSKGSL